LKIHHNKLSHLPKSHPKPKEKEPPGQNPPNKPTSHRNISLTACAAVNLRPQSTGTSRYHGSTINHRQPKSNEPNGSSFTVIGTDRRTSIPDARPTTASVDPQVPPHQLSPSWIARSTLNLLCFVFCGSEEGRKRSFSYLVGSTKKKKKSFIMLLVVLREVGSI
jgi:hypothetical protein